MHGDSEFIPNHAIHDSANVRVLPFKQGDLKYDGKEMAQFIRWSVKNPYQYGYSLYSIFHDQI